MSFLMQARSTSSGLMVAWLVSDPDWAGAEFPGPGSPEYIAVASLPVIAVPGGAVGSMQFHGEDHTLRGCDELGVLGDGNAHHTGSPTHQENEIIFRDPFAAYAGGPRTEGATVYGEARTTWAAVQSTDHADIQFTATIVDLTAWGDCYVTVQWNVTVATTEGCSWYSVDAMLKRASGTWTIPYQAPTLIASTGTITHAPTLTVGTSGSAQITFKGSVASGYTGHGNWMGDAHFQAVPKPS